MLPPDLGEAVGRGPGAVGGGQDRFIRERAGAASPKGGKGLVELAFAEKAKDEHGCRKLRAFVGSFCRKDILQAGK